MRLDDLLLNDTDRKQLLAVVSSGVQSILLTATSGFGKKTIAMALAQELTNGRVERISLIEPLESSITIDQIRKLKSFFVLKTLDSTDKRVAVLLEAESMTVEAQNSLLKLLEEPPQNCFLLLTSSHPGLLLGTISSRVQTVRLRNPLVEDTVKYFSQQGYSSMEIEKGLPMTNGLVGVTAAILGSEDSPYIESLNRAKVLLGQKHLERLKSVDAIAKDKQSVLSLLDALKTIATSATRKNSHNTDLWKKVLHGTMNAEKQLSQNASTKLVLTNLFLSL